MRSLPFLLAVLFLMGCKGDGPEAQEPTTVKAPDVAPPAPDAAPLSPFDGLGTRYDGIYRTEQGGAIYMIRLFPEGRAVLINGIAQIEDELPQYLTRDAAGDPDKGWYNVKVDVWNDSLFFVTTPRRGEITYRGAVDPQGDLSLLRHSHITGKQQVMVYEYRPDGSY